MLNFANIFEISISVVTAILGLSYPLFVERIGQIARLYKSLKISRRFNSEIPYQLFHVLLLICIIEMFVFPFVIFGLRSNKVEMVLLTMQAISVFFLSIDMTQVFILLMIYNSPERLLRRMMTCPDTVKRFEELELMMEFSSTEPMYEKVFQKSSSEVYRYIDEFQEKELKEEYG